MGALCVPFPTYLHLMRRHLLAALLVIPSGFTFGQSWCPPGATWTYEAGLFLAGFVRMEYVGDTLLDGYTAQRIDRYAAIQYPQPPPGPTYGGPPIESQTSNAAITRFADDVVYTWQNGEWDTLYWFGASPGQGWTVAHNTDPQCDPFMVSDTGTTIIDGIPLHWIQIEPWHRVYERIGSTFDLFMYCPNLIVDGPLGLRCYRDGEIAVQFSGTNCEAFAGIADALDAPGTRPTPNPGTDQFTLQLPGGIQTITILDPIGNAVLNTRSSSSSVYLDTRAFRAGTYFVRIVDANGTMSTHRWVKE